MFTLPSSPLSVLSIFCGIKTQPRLQKDVPSFHGRLQRVEDIEKSDKAYNKKNTKCDEASIRDRGKTVHVAYTNTNAAADM
jgi:hypothetical protein